MLRALPGIMGLAGIVFGLLVLPAHADGELADKQVERLANLVRHDCGSCHGLTLKGGLGWPLTPERLADLDHETVRDIILYGVEATPMPGWQGLLSEGEASWIANALKTGAIR